VPLTDVTVLSVSVTDSTEASNVSYMVMAGIDTAVARMVSSNCRVMTPVFMLMLWNSTNRGAVVSPTSERTPMAFDVGTVTSTLPFMSRTASLEMARKHEPALTHSGSRRLMLLRSAVVGTIDTLV